MKERIYGIYVSGVEPKSERGKSFGNNCWNWRPLWDFVFDQCGDVISEEDHRKGHYNDGHLIPREKSERIAQRLLALCANGRVLDVEREYKKQQEALPDEICDLCHGTGTRPDIVVLNGCNACHGKGARRPSDTYYPFSAENVLEFAEFCKDSGGFRIY